MNNEESHIMVIKDIQVIAQTMNLEPGKLNKTDLIHLIQKEEGNNACYATPEVTSCGQEDCLWRSDCLNI